YISSLRLKANQSQSIAVEVKPGPGAAAGEFPITVRIAAGDAKGEAALTVMLTGTYELEVGTPSGLLSLEAQQGQPANVSFYVKNSGTAPNANIRFMSFKPENWKVEFKPERIDLVEPGALKQVEMIVTPAEEALIGDYSVAVRVEGEKVSKTLEFRVSVKASSAWGWIGIGLIVAVIAGLLGLFRAFGRR
nr:NEW3 domain-containing protein [Desulfobacterales bacterium]